MTDDRETEPGLVLRTYQRAKAKIGALAGRGKAKGTAMLSGDAKDDSVDAGNDWKGKPAEEVTEADQVRSQEEMKETFDGDGIMPSDKRHKGQKEDGAKDATTRTDLPDGSATAVMQGGGDAPEAEDTDETRRADEADLGGTVDDGGRRGSVEAPAPDVHASIGTDDNPAAPAMSTLDEAALAKISEDEVGRLPDQGLGLDDGPGVSFSGDARN